MALPNKPLGELPAVTNPEVVEHDVDVLIIGGGMAACGAAFEDRQFLIDRHAVLLLCRQSGTVFL